MLTSLWSHRWQSSSSRNSSARAPCARVSAPSVTLALPALLLLCPMRANRVFASRFRSLASGSLPQHSPAKACRPECLNRRAASALLPVGTCVLSQDTFETETVSLSFDELMGMLQRNSHLVPTVIPKYAPLCQPRQMPPHKFLAKTPMPRVSQFAQPLPDMLL